MSNEKTSFLLGKKNIAVIALGFLIVVTGFIMMSGGKTENPDQWDMEKFSKRRITYAPITVLLGFTVVGFGIMLKPKTTLVEDQENAA